MAGYHIYSTLWLSINFKKQISFVKKATDSCLIDRIRSKLHGRCTFFHVCGSRSRWFSFDSAMKQEDSWSLQRSKSTQNGTSRAFSPPSSLVSFLSCVLCLVMSSSDRAGCDGSSPYNHILRRVVALDGNGNPIVTDCDNHRTAVITTVRHN